MPTMNERVAAYRPFVELLANRFTGRFGAEFDDLVQEGLVSVWQAHERGVEPSATIIQHSMRNWVRTVRRQQLV